MTEYNKDNDPGMSAGDKLGPKDDVRPQTHDVDGNEPQRGDRPVKNEHYDRSRRGDRPRRNDRSNFNDRRQRSDSSSNDDQGRPHYERRSRNDSFGQSDDGTENTRPRYDRRPRNDSFGQSDDGSETARPRYERRPRNDSFGQSDDGSENARPRYDRRLRNDSFVQSDDAENARPRYDRRPRNESFNASGEDADGSRPHYNRRPRYEESQAFEAASGTVQGEHPVQADGTADDLMEGEQTHFEQRSRSHNDFQDIRDLGERPHFERRDPEKIERQDNRNRTPARLAPRPPLGRKPQQPAETRPNAKKGRQPFDGKDHLYEVIKIRLARSQRLIEVNTNEKPFEPNQLVLVRIHRNVLLATTVGYRYRRIAEINSLPYIMRDATEEDVRIDNENVAIEKHAQELATAFAIEKNLQMKVLSADLSHDHKNITINFASDVRVDFREMVAYLAGQLKLRVEMYQLGLRNGTGLICALGSCGQRLCCGRFLGQFDPVAVKLLRAQGLATNPKRISGVCGRLYCCLSYEYCDYLKERRSLPKKGKRVLTRWGLGRITDTDPLREEVVITYDNGEIQRLTMHDYVFVTDSITEKVEKEEIVFPLEPARFYLNNDPTNAVETPLHTKAPAPAPSKGRSRHATATTLTKKVALERHKSGVMPAVKPAAAVAKVSPAIVHAEKPVVSRQAKRHRGKALPPEFAVNAAGLVVRRSDSAVEMQDESVKPNNTECVRPEGERAVRRSTPVNIGENVKADISASQEGIEAESNEPCVMAPPPQGAAPHPLPKDSFHPSNPRRRHLRTRPPISPGNR